jgi:hypothetical protein
MAFADTYIGCFAVWGLPTKRATARQWVIALFVMSDG